MEYTITALIITGFIIWMIPGTMSTMKKIPTKIFKSAGKVQGLDVFDNNYIDAKIFYLQEFSKLPSISYVNNLDVSKALSSVDSALMRKGRLIAKYEFNKLDEVKAQRLSDHLGFSNKIDRPMTLAEITNPGDMDVVSPQAQVIGFRREALMN